MFIIHEEFFLDKCVGDFLSLSFNARKYFLILFHPTIRFISRYFSQFDFYRSVTFDSHDKFSFLFLSALNTD